MTLYTNSLEIQESILRKEDTKALEILSTLKNSLEFEKQYFEQQLNQTNSILTEVKLLLSNTQDPN